MPELPEVETVRRGLERVMVGRIIASVDQRRADLRIPFPKDFVARLTGRCVATLTRRAKYLLVTLDDGTVLIMHLGMSGRFLIDPGKAGQDQPGRFHDRSTPGSNGASDHDHVVFRLDNGTRITYSDPRRFGLMTLSREAALDQHKLLKDMGIEPLSNGFNGAYLDRVLRAKKTPIKAALLDQRVVAGIGNIYACEALFRAGLSPRRSSHSVPGKRAARLATAIQIVLKEAIAAGGSTLRDYVKTDGALGYFQHSFAVYDRTGHICPTPGCGSRIQRIVQANRSTFFCGKCQR